MYLSDLIGATLCQYTFIFRDQFFQWTCPDPIFDEAAGCTQKIWSGSKIKLLGAFCSFQRHKDMCLTTYEHCYTSASLPRLHDVSLITDNALQLTECNWPQFS